MKINENEFLLGSAKLVSSRQPQAVTEPKAHELDGLYLQIIS